MFKNATICGFNRKSRLEPAQTPSLAFVPPLDLQVQSDGWAPVRDGERVYSNNGHILLNYTVEKKHVPAGAVKLVVAERAKVLEVELGFAPGKKAMRELTERVRDELLPRALSSRSSTKVWIDRANGRIVIDSTSNSTVEAIQRLLMKTFDDIGLEDTKWPREKVITEWLHAAPPFFTCDDQVALCYPGEKRTTVKFDKADLGSDDVMGHINAGAGVQALAMTYLSKVSFIMTADLQIRRIRPLDVLKLSAAEAKDVDRFDNDFVLMTGELSALLNAIAKEA